MAADNTIELARWLQLKGRIAEAEKLYRERLDTDPESLDALEGLGVLLFQQGRAEEAAGLFARGVAIQPASVRFQANLGEALRMTRRYDLALDHLRKAVALDPADVQTWNSLGLLSFDLRRYPAAVHAYREAIRLQSQFVHAHINLANTLRAMGQPGAAADELRVALEIEPNNALALINRVTILIEMGDPTVLAEAETAARRAVALVPRLPLALNLLARVLRLQGRAEQAIEFEQRARTVETGAQSSPCPETPTATDHHSPAEASVASPGSPAGDAPADGPYMKGLARLAEGRFDEAEMCLREAIQLDGSMADAWVALAAVYAERGQIDLSSEAARTALAIRPGLAEAYWRLATNQLGDLPDADVEAMETLVHDESLSNDDRALLHFGLGAVMNRRGLYAQAAALTDIANLHQSAGKFERGLTYNPDQNSESISRIIAAFTPELLARCAGWGVPDTRPVFVVGFPRSGTTLTEQILSSHPRIKGAGELQDLQRVFQAIPEIVGDATCDRFAALGRLEPDSVKAAARRYLQKLETLAPAGFDRVVDKMPDNVNHLGLIALLFPHAKVILCRRDPRDIAISCWQTGFRSCPWNNDWDRIARRLADYQRVLAHWERVRPLPYLDLPYEDMVADLEHHARLLIEFVGLEWDPACLEFHTNPRAVRTPSLAQVRQPIHSRSAGRWRKYEPYIGPLFDAIARHGVIVPQGG